MDADDDADDGRHDADEHSRLVLAAMQALAKDQHDRAERVRSSARNTFLYLSALFTGAQTVALSGFVQDKVGDEERKLIVLFGVAAAVMLAVTGVITIIVDRLRKVKDISPADIEREADLAIERNEFVGDRLTKLYRAAANQRAAAVDDRAGWLTGLTAMTVITVTLVIVEIVASLAARVS